MRAESWRRIPEFPGYSVSSDGRVRRETRTSNSTYKGMHLVPWLVSGYPLVGLWSAGRRRRIHVHRLVASAWIGPRLPGQQTNHKNGVKTDNRVSNLEYVTAAGNTKHAYDLGLIAKGEKHARAKLSDRDVKRIRALCPKVSQRRVAAMFGVTQSHVSLLIRGLSRKG